MKRVVLLLMAVLFSSSALAAESSLVDVRTYDPDPLHLWNQLHARLFVRTAPDGAAYGHDRLDPLFWGRTTHLLEGDSHREALNVLDEFLSKQGERLIRDPLKRAFLQHDLWALFDWSASPQAAHHLRERAELRVRLAKIMHRLALTNSELKALPDNYARALATNTPASLPRDLFLRDSNWISVSINNETAPRHTQSVGGRSTFHVLVRLPEGRAATLAYLVRLQSFKRRRIGVEWPDTDHIQANISIPQFPSQTEWALVRRMRVIDASGRIRATPVVESIQLRRYLLVPQDGQFETYEAQFNAQQTFEFVARRTSNGDLRAVQPGERDFYQFQAHDTDPFELPAEALAQYPERDPFRERHQRDVLRSCLQCHGAPGIHSVQSIAQMTNDRLSSAAKLIEAKADRPLSEEISLDSYQFGLLRGLWEGTGQKNATH